MSAAVKSAFATPFLWTSGGTSDMTAHYGATTKNVACPTTYARMILGTGYTATSTLTEPLPDLVQCITQALNVATNPTVIWSPWLDPVTGLVNIATNTNVTLTLAAGLAKLTGLPAGPTGPATSFVGTRPPQHLALCGSVPLRATYSPMIPGAFARGADGTVYGVTSGITTEALEVPVEFAPTDVGAAAGVTAPWTPAHQDPTSGTALRALGTNAVWTWDDAMVAAQAGSCGLALGNFDSIALGNGGSFSIVTVDPQQLSTLPVWQLQIPPWTRYSKASFRVTRLTTSPVTTR